MLREEIFEIPAADLGPENPVPPISPCADVHENVRFDNSLTDEDRENLGWGLPPSQLPYRDFDGFNRVRKPRAFKAIILENRFLKATFIPELGGHLWSLVSKKDNRELLSKNPVYQPCNLALRKAWISGGVEWNIGWRGHWPYTCSPLFSAIHKTSDGTPVLRMWEWPRVRRVPYQMDVWLPEDSPVLLVRVCIRNPYDKTVPLYWWSNIATEQHPNTRVLASAEEALGFNYGTNAMCRFKLPNLSETDDISIPGQQRGSRDIFFCVPKKDRPWIASLEEDGRGLFQTSTSLLHGRKLFRWGVQKGGENWQKFLGSPDYIEIQAGLAETQLHNHPMPPHATWAWIEAYGDLQADPAITHGSDWTRARLHAADAIENIIPNDTLEKMLSDSFAWADEPPATLFQMGSGWGALEAKLRALDGLDPVFMPGIVYPESSMTEDQAPWNTLLDTGALPALENPLTEPGCFVHTEEWLPRLEKSIREGHVSWNAYLHLGVLYWHANRPHDAIDAWQKSLAQKENPWALRSIGAYYSTNRMHKTARPYFEKAYRMLPTCRTFALDFLNTLNDISEFESVLREYETLPREVAEDGRVALPRIRALIRLHRLDEAEALIDETEPSDDMKEGETGLSDFWFEIQIRREAAKQGLDAPTPELRAHVTSTLNPPARIDYRMGG